MGWAMKLKSKILLGAFAIIATFGTGGAATAQFGGGGTVAGENHPEREQLQLACDQGSSISCYNLAEKYYYGFPHREGHRALMEKACALRFAAACARMAATYQYGVFVPQDLERAIAYQRQVIEIDPNFPDAKKSLEWAQAMLTEKSAAAQSAAPTPAPLQAPATTQRPSLLSLGGFDFNRPIQTSYLNKLTWKKWPIRNPRGPDITFLSILSRNVDLVEYIKVFYILENRVFISFERLNCGSGIVEVRYHGDLSSATNYSFKIVNADASVMQNYVEFNAICDVNNLESANIIVP